MRGRRPERDDAVPSVRTPSRASTHGVGRARAATAMATRGPRQQQQQQGGDDMEGMRRGLRVRGENGVSGRAGCERTEAPTWAYGQGEAPRACTQARECRRGNAGSGTAEKHHAWGAWHSVSATIYKVPGQVRRARAALRSSALDCSDQRTRVSGDQTRPVERSFFSAFTPGAIVSTHDPRSDAPTRHTHSIHTRHAVVRVSKKRWVRLVPHDVKTVWWTDEVLDCAPIRCEKRPPMCLPLLV